MVCAVFFGPNPCFNLQGRNHYDLGGFTQNLHGGNIVGISHKAVDAICLEILFGSDFC